MFVTTFESLDSTITKLFHIVRSPVNSKLIVANFGSSVITIRVFTIVVGRDRHVECLVNLMEEHDFVVS